MGNKHMLFGGYEAIATITNSDNEWTAHGRLVSDDDDEREGFAFFIPPRLVGDGGIAAHTR